MKISLNMLLQKLKDYCPQALGDSSLDLSFKHVRLFSKSDLQLLPTTLYVTYFKEIEEVDLAMAYAKAQSPIYFVCVADGPEAFHRLSTPLRGLYISSRFELFQIYNALQDLFSELMQWDVELRYAILKGQGIQSMLDISESHFTNPILVWDPSFEILAHTKNIPIQSPYIKSMVEMGHFPGEVIQHLLEKRLLAGNHETKTRLFPAKHSLSGCASYIRHYFRGEVRFYSTGQMLCNHPADPAELELLEHFFCKISEYLDRNYHDLQEDQPLHRLFLQDLLDGKLSDKKMIEEKAKLFNMAYSDNYVVYRFLMEDFVFSQATYFIEHLSRILPGAKMMIYHESILLLKQVNAYSCNNQAKQTRFRHLLQQFGISCGISSTFKTLPQIKNAFEQAGAAARLGKMLSPTGESIYLYKEYYFYHMLEIYHQKMDLDMLYYQKLNCLIECDQKRGSNHIELLEIYFNNNMSISATAEAMYLHRNSIAYRIKRIEEMLGLEFTNHDAVLRLNLSLKVLHYLSTLREEQQAEGEHPDEMNAYSFIKSG